MAVAQSPNHLPQTDRILTGKTKFNKNYVQKTGAQCWTTSKLRSHLPTSCLESFRYTHPTIYKNRAEGDTLYL